MSNFRSRPNDQYIHEADWQQLYVLTEHWKSDLSFYEDDLKFLRNLIDKYFMWISEKENIDMVREIEVSLLNIEKQCGSLAYRVNKHPHHLAELIDNPFAYDSHKFRAEHQQLEDDIATFVKDFRSNRKEVFTVTDYLMDTEQFVKQVVEDK
ncbi:hypothetical protein [Maribacter halichondriae]|uniref:hypothetical protein n=1 Tax=Maribacter halichondriae TaxID=2980554 RepID=UPI0023596B4C|nr:hypothetical protein [Maribacter sp. Hal144]